MEKKSIADPRVRRAWRFVFDLVNRGYTLEDRKDGEHINIMAHGGAPLPLPEPDVQFIAEHYEEICQLIPLWHPGSFDKLLTKEDINFLKGNNITTGRAKQMLRMLRGEDA